MSRRFVKASGGCSAPAGADLDAAKRRLGKMKFKTDKPVLPGQPLAVQLRLSHPNLTGLQMDQVTRLYAPAHYVETVKISFEGRPVFSAETGFSLSENPSFRFHFVPDGAGELHAEVVDTDGLRFTGRHSVIPGE